MTNDPNARSDRINGEMLDTIDEELEMRSTTIAWPSC